MFPKPIIFWYIGKYLLNFPQYFVLCHFIVKMMLNLRRLVVTQNKVIDSLQIQIAISN